MTQYTPAFPSIYTGSLRGKYPACTVFQALFPLIDSQGIVDCDYGYISLVSGIPENLVRQGIHELMQPDPMSRSPAQEGRRLVPIDPSREWGWRVVNYGAYRERARSVSKAKHDVAMGLAAERKRKQRLKEAEDEKKRHAQSRRVTPGHAESSRVSPSEEEGKEEVRGKRGSGGELPLDLGLPPSGKPHVTNRPATGDRLPEDYKPPERDWDAAVGRYGLTVATAQLRAMRTYWCPVESKEGYKRPQDWAQVWRMWLARDEAKGRLKPLSASDSPSDPTVTPPGARVS